MDEQAATSLPAGEYAIVEVLGHRTLVGRVTEVERFGTKLLSIEPLYQSQLLPAVLIGGSSLYAFTSCTAEVAAQRQPTHEYQLPASLRATLPPAMLPSPDDEADFDPAFLNEDDDGGPLS